MEVTQLALLIERYLDGVATEEERRVVDEWYERFEALPGIVGKLGEEEEELARRKGFLTIKDRLSLRTE